MIKNLIKQQFKTSEQAQNFFLLLAVSIGFIGFLIVIIAAFFIKK